MKSLFKENFITGVFVILMCLAALLSIVTSVKSISHKPPANDIYTACIAEANKKANGIVPKFDEAFIVETNNPNIWMTYIPFDMTQGHLTMDAMLHCRVIRKDKEFSALIL